jgi:hypothetical protein
MTDVTVTERLLEDELAPSEQLRTQLGTDLDLLILPEFVEETGEGVVASFAEAAQALRVDLADWGVRVKLATPDGATPRSYEQHSAEYVLPVVLGAPVALASLWQMVRWIGEWFQEHPEDEIRYREATYDTTTGSFVVREVSGRGDKVAEAVRTRLEAAEQPREETR